MPTRRLAPLACLCLLAGCSDDPAAGGPGLTDLDATTDVGAAGDAGVEDDGTGRVDVTADAGAEDTGAASDTGGGSDATTDASDDAPTVDPTGCPADLFVQADPHPANTAYPDPMLEARCEAGELVVESNGIIGYEFVPLTPNDLAAQDYEWRVPIEPTWIDDPVDIPLLGVAGFSVSGLPFYGPNEGEFPDPYGDPVFNAIVDDCTGHTAQRGDYHFHAMVVDCIVANASDDGPSPIIGYALDGYPIYGPLGCLDEACDELVEMQSGWEQTGDPTTYAWDAHAYVGGDDPSILDRCNGRVQPDGSYGYHATSGFPYILGCYHGDADAAEGGGGGGGEPTSCNSDADCVGECNGGGTGCGCAPSPMGNICVPTCEETADCPDGFVCNDAYCRPEGGPP